MSTDLLSIPLETLDGQPATLAEHADGPILVVNVASRCGLTPQYAGLEELQDTYGDRGLTVVGFPCNQFGGQEPGSAEQIQSFCSTTYGISFPIMAKVEVNGPDRHPVYDVLTRTPDADGVDGDVHWNFEKFLLDRDGAVVARFRPTTKPEDPVVVEAIEAQLDR